MSYWTVPPMFKGRTVAVLASGPSMSQSVADSVRHLPRIAVNTTYQLARDAEIIYSADAEWWAANPEALQCPGIKASIEILPKILPNTPDGVQILRNTGRTDFDPNPGALRTLSNSGAQALQIAVHAGAARILLLGFDMRGGHWHDDYAKPLRNRETDDYQTWVVNYRALALALAGRGVSVINCTAGSALDCFPSESLESVLRVASIDRMAA